MGPERIKCVCCTEVEVPQLPSTGATAGLDVGIEDSVLGVHARQSKIYIQNNRKHPYSFEVLHNIVMNDTDIILRLLKVGKHEGEPNEWDAAIDDTGVNNAIWHWYGIYTWGMDELSNPDFRAIRGGDGSRDWDCSETWDREDTGWRPVLEPVSVKLSQRLRGKKVAIWHGQQILYGRVASYNAYDLYLTDAQPLFSIGFDRTPWYADLGESCLVVDRNQIAAIQLY